MKLVSILPQALVIKLKCQKTGQRLRTVDAVAVLVVVVGAAPNLYISIFDKRGLFMRNNRQGLIVWFQHMRNIKQIKRLGHLIYVSKKIKYAVLYVDQKQIESVEKRLLRYPFVSKVDRSYKPFVNTVYDNVIPDKAKQHDYKVEI